VVDAPGIAAHPAARADFVSLVAIFPAICEMLGLELPYGVQGRSLWPLLVNW
jgi:arylsulfatase A-like enzyme